MPLDTDVQLILDRLGIYPLKEKPSRKNNEAINSLENKMMKHKKNGFIYKGPWKDGTIPHGFGSVLFKNGQFYHGIIRDGTANGYGTLIMTDKSYFNGNFENN